MKKVVFEVPACSLDFAFSIIGGKYKGRILWRLHLNRIMRYGELKRAIPDVTTKMLTQSLRELENENLIFRKVYLEVPPKVEYTLTKTGQELIPFMQSLKEWGDRQIQKKLQKRE